MSAEAPRHGFIHELHGLRGLALTLVVVFHLFGHGRVSGGVDVFLLISGFLVTRSLVHRLEQREPGSLRRHYARAATRLIPAALLVLVVTVALAAWLLPVSALLDVGREARASALYVQNWHLISTQLSYGAAGPDASLLQHFWSLSVQGQFLVVWPLALVAWGWLSRRYGWSLRLVVTCFAVAVTVASFAYAVYLVDVDQPVAYFSTWSRLWQLSLGAVAAMALARVRIPRPWSGLMGWVGLAMLVATGFVFDAAHTFPGVTALWPVGAAVLVLAAGGGERSALRSTLEWWPVRKVADLAYELYLWHWPLLVLYLTVTGQDRITATQAVVLLTVALVISWVTRRWVSEPARGGNGGVPARSALVSVAAVAVMVTVTSVGLVRVQSAQDAALDDLLAASGQHPGALVAVDDATVWTETPRPGDDLIRSDLPEVYGWGCIQDWRDSPELVDVLTCQITEPGEGKPLVVLTGGSHAVQWYSPLKAIAEDYGWELRVIDKDGCRFADAEGWSTESAACDEWNREAVGVIAGLEPDLVFTVSTTTYRETYVAEEMRQDQLSVWSRLGESGIEVAAIRDNPRFTWNVADCLASGGTAETCGRARQGALIEDVESLLVGASENVSFLDLSDIFCTADLCPAIIGNVVVYRDHDHITNVFAASARHRLEQEMKEAFPGMFRRAS